MDRTYQQVNGLRVSGNPPKWATDLLAEIRREEGIRVWALDWSRRKGQESGGEAFTSGLIRMRAGKDRREQRIVLLHEVAHVGAPVTSHHDRAMYRIAWRLWRKYAKSTPLAVIYAREGQYRTTALSVAKELGLRGARAALKEQRADNAEWRHSHTYTVDSIRRLSSEGWVATSETCKRKMSDGRTCGAWRGQHRKATPADLAAIEVAA